MKINGNAIRPGMVIEHKGRLWVAVKIQHTQPGKGGAYQQVELKDVRDGTKLNERFRASETVERVRLDQKSHQFLFADGDNYTFMDNETYEQTIIGRDMIGAERAQFLADGMTVTIESYEGSPIGIELPDTVIMAVVDAERPPELVLGHVRHLSFIINAYHLDRLIICSTSISGEEPSTQSSPS